ncbi:DHHW family protein [Brevibacillus daliensis]|uniref:DHHW family protein n=1 Tax=Brevibacillus daliensis TaxID=2892995 RepID=UPI001E51F186|nr:DHHW family protein [Brevibacillus daliensis]
MTRSHTVLIVGFLLIIFGLGIATFLIPDRPLSWWENRSLAQVPEVSIEGLKTGNYFKQVESYVTDQFPGRDRWMAMYVKSELMQNKTFVKGTYVSPENTMIKKPLGQAPLSVLEHAADALNGLGTELQKQNIPFYYALMPAKVNIMADFLPEDVPRGFGKQNKEQVLAMLDPDKVMLIDGEQALREAYSPDQIPSFYFQTDHHWNIDGAMFAYQTILQNIGEYFSEVVPQDANENLYSLRCENAKLMGSWNK